MDIGSGILGASTILGGVAVVFKIFTPNGNGKIKHCEDHSGVCAKQDGFDAWLNKIEAKLDKAIERR
jgi:hypothetical protein